MEDRDRDRGREAALAEEFERVARRLRAGEATVYGYRVDTDPPGERGAVAYDDRWLSFEFESDREG